MLEPTCAARDRFHYQISKYFNQQDDLIPFDCNFKTSVDYQGNTSLQNHATQSELMGTLSWSDRFEYYFGFGPAGVQTIISKIQELTKDALLETANADANLKADLEEMTRVKLRNFTIDVCNSNPEHREGVYRRLNIEANAVKDLNCSNITDERLNGMNLTLLEMHKLVLKERALIKVVEESFNGTFFGRLSIVLSRTIILVSDLSQVILHMIRGITPPVTPILEDRNTPLARLRDIVKYRMHRIQENAKISAEEGCLIWKGNALIDRVTPIFYFLNFKVNLNFTEIILRTQKGAEPEKQIGSLQLSLLNPSEAAINPIILCTNPTQAEIDAKTDSEKSPKKAIIKIIKYVNDSDFSLVIKSIFGQFIDEIVKQDLIVSDSNDETTRELFASRASKEKPIYNLTLHDTCDFTQYYCERYDDLFTRAVLNNVIEPTLSLVSMYKAAQSIDLSQRVVI